MSIDMKHKPWLKFFVQHWLGDQRLCLCGPAAHGVLINLMAIAHNSDRYGYIMDGNGPITADILSSMRGWHVLTVRKAWGELEVNGRIARGDDGVWYIKRMVADHAYVLQQSELGKTGGNPTLKAPVKAPLKLEQSKKRKETYTEGFEGFWKLYPRNVEKGAAFKAWKKHGCESFAEKIMETLNKFVKCVDWRKDGGTYVPHPQKWLNQSGWDDSPYRGNRR